MLSILNSVSSLQAENAIANTTNALNNNLQELSTGLRITNGSSDAAGLSIANGLQANIAALTQSGNNASDGVGLLQTADGALSQVTGLLDTAMTLATEASNGGLSASQSAALDQQYAAIQAEIDNIGTTTDFNGAAVFGTSGTVYQTDGTSGGSSTTSVAIGALSSSGTGGLGLTSDYTSKAGVITATGVLTTTAGAQGEVKAISAAIETVAAERGAIGAQVNSLQASEGVDTTAVTNLTSAMNDIQNADVGQTVAQMTQNSVLEQTGMAALSQSNQIQENVLKLLQ
jgi:flagellin